MLKAHVDAHVTTERFVNELYDTSEYCEQLEHCFWLNWSTYCAAHEDTHVFPFCETY